MRRLQGWTSCAKREDVMSHEPKRVDAALGEKTCPQPQAESGVLAGRDTDRAVTQVGAEFEGELNVTTSHR
jgi:hypothetical protein